MFKTPLKHVQERSNAKQVTNEFVRPQSAAKSRPAAQIPQKTIPVHRNQFSLLNSDVNDEDEDVILINDDPSTKSNEPASKRQHSEMSQHTPSPNSVNAGSGKSKGLKGELESLKNEFCSLKVKILP